MRIPESTRAQATCGSQTIKQSPPAHHGLGPGIAPQPDEVTCSSLFDSGCSNNNQAWTRLQQLPYLNNVAAFYAVRSDMDNLVPLVNKLLCSDHILPESQGCLCVARLLPVMNQDHGIRGTRIAFNFLSTVNNTETHKTNATQ